MSAQKNREPKSCANSYQILQNVNDGSVITRPLRCNRNDCPICSKIYKEEMKERIEAAQKEHKLQYMLTISPELIDKSNAIPINNAALVALRHLQEITGSFKYVLSTANGTMVKPRKLANTFNTIQKNCGFEKTYGIHALRHTFASNLFNKGTDVKIVSKLLGHSSTSITCNIYIHVIEDVKAQAVALIDEV